MRSMIVELKKLIRDESGQGATEYILLLVVVVGIAMIFRNEIKSIVGDKIQDLKQGIDTFKPQ